jgi:prepilin-type N-terminal cleavage/methylation domain-containing protein
MERFSFIISKLNARIRSRRVIRAPKGFTLIEMLIVLAIFVIITSVILVSQTSFTRSLLLTDSTYTVALSLRETQSLGLSSKAFSTILNAGYGIHFDTSSNKSYVQFADISNSPTSPPTWCPTGTAGHPDAKPGNCLYDGPSSGELAQTYQFGQGYTIGKFCGYKNTIPLGCSPSGITSLDIVFQRPNTVTIMTVKNTSGSYLQADTACIQITAPTNDASQYVKVTQLGEISVVSSCP